MAGAPLPPLPSWLYDGLGWQIAAGWRTVSVRTALSAKNPKSPEEAVARALCRLDGHPEDITSKGAPLWASYLPEAHAAIKALEDYSRRKPSEDSRQA